ncbi:holo-[acyl-carrier-protein] synthase [Paenibacillus sambharensis]|uniref:Holo-[acyl-carrier-protein] synthase n=1 Tax=Paenibacillus sambharensis TaxID=1803190 RepID=A0A2W1LQL6_9BACL|nr:holo-ACP synthase [Paenibacillus sambharensis]PZD96804.1 holo-[acyl-carrier-protein] synthase [Paenibacillus sambharensis]
MIFGIGLDIQSIAQIDASIRKQGEYFLRRIYTGQEIDYCSSKENASQHFAARWAVKEAFSKAAGTGIARGLCFRDVETVHLKTGQPHIVLYGKALDLCEQHDLRVLVSITHSEEYAAAQIILCSRLEDE